MTLNPLPAQETFPFKLPDLPYAKSALAPHITENTFNYHYEKHHQTYVTNLNNLVKGTDLEQKTLEELIMLSGEDASKAAIFNNAAQVWNHTFYWHCMKPKGGGMPQGKLLEMINDAFGSFDIFKEQFKQAGITQFGSGWAWLVLEDGKLKITKTPNADLPMNHGQRALLTVDVWEHAYYLDYQNRRPDYVTMFLDNLVNWDFVAKNLSIPI